MTPKRVIRRQKRLIPASNCGTRRRRCVCVRAKGHTAGSWRFGTGSVKWISGWGSPVMQLPPYDLCSIHHKSYRERDVITIVIIFGALPRNRLIWVLHERAWMIVVSVKLTSLECLAISIATKKAKGAVAIRKVR